jgi:hypothetical protein
MSTYQSSHPNLKDKNIETLDIDDLKNIIEALCKTDNETNHRMAITFVDLMNKYDALVNDLDKFKTMNTILCRAIRDTAEGTYCDTCRKAVANIALAALSEHEAFLKKEDNERP